MRRCDSDFSRHVLYGIIAYLMIFKRLHAQPLFYGQLYIKEGKGEFHERIGGFASFAQLWRAGDF